MFCSKCLYKSSLHMYVSLYFDVLSQQYCSANIGVIFTFLTVLVTTLPIGIIHIFQDLPLLSLSLCSVIIPSAQGLCLFSGQLLKSLWVQMCAL